MIDPITVTYMVWIDDKRRRRLDILQNGEWAYPADCRKVIGAVTTSGEPASAWESVRAKIAALCIKRTNPSRRAEG